MRLKVIMFLKNKNLQQFISMQNFNPANNIIELTGFLKCKYPPFFIKAGLNLKKKANYLLASTGDAANFISLSNHPAPPSFSTMNSV